MPEAAEFGYAGYLGELHLTIGRARVALGRPEEARTAFHKVMELLRGKAYRDRIEIARQSLAAI